MKDVPVLASDADKAIRYRVMHEEIWLYGPTVKKFVEDNQHSATRQQIMDIVIQEANPQHVCNFACEYPGFARKSTAEGIIAAGKDGVAALKYAEAFPEADKDALRGAVIRSGDKSILYAYARKIDKVPVEYLYGLAAEISAENKVKMLDSAKSSTLRAFDVGKHETSSSKPTQTTSGPRL